MIRPLGLALAITALATPCMLAAQARTGSPTPANAVKPLDPIEMTTIAPKVRSIKAEPSTLTVHVGETIPLGQIVVTVIDSSGKTRGRLIGFDFGIKPGEPAMAVPRQVTGVRPGTTELTILYPGSSWGARKDPRAEVKVKIIVVK